MRPHNRKLLWSPHSREVFAIGASEHLKLYEFCKPSGGAASASTALQVEDTAGVRPPSVRLLSSVSDVQQLRCVAWCPLTAAPWILAVGTASGRVVLHDCAPTGAPGPTTVRSEFVPGVPRACFAVSWNEVRTNLIAAALDKVRGDSGVVVWDAERQRARGSGGARRHGARRQECAIFERRRVFCGAGGLPRRVCAARRARAAAAVASLTHVVGEGVFD